MKSTKHFYGLKMCFSREKTRCCKANRAPSLRGESKNKCALDTTNFRARRIPPKRRYCLALLSPIYNSYSDQTEEPYRMSSYTMRENVLAFFRKGMKNDDRSRYIRAVFTMNASYLNTHTRACVYVYVCDAMWCRENIKEK